MGKENCGKSQNSIGGKPQPPPGKLVECLRETTPKLEFPRKMLFDFLWFSVYILEYKSWIIELISEGVEIMLQRGTGRGWWKQGKIV